MSAYFDGKQKYTKIAANISWFTNYSVSLM